MFLNDFKDLIFTSEKVGKMQVVKVQAAGIIGFPHTHTTYHVPYIFIFSGMNGVNHNFIGSQQVKHNGQIIRLYVQRNKGDGISWRSYLAQRNYQGS